MLEAYPYIFMDCYVNTSDFNRTRLARFLCCSSDQNKPEQGVRVTMTSCNKKPKPDCSFSVLVQCSHSGVDVCCFTISNITDGLITEMSSRELLVDTTFHV